MGDVTASKKADALNLSEELALAVEQANFQFKTQILSPLTVTLGDEFQGVLSQADDYVDLLLWFTKRRLERRWPFELHFSMVQEEITTPINRDIAHGMIGPALTIARELLTRKDRDRPRYQFRVHPEPTSMALNKIFHTIESLEARWRRKDFELISQLMSGAGNTEIAQMRNVDRTQIWKRRKTLLTDDVCSLFEAAHFVLIGSRDVEHA